MKLKNRYKIIIAVFVCLFTAGATLAYFSENHSIQNRFSTLTPEMQIKENFNREDKWLPGEEKLKEVKFKNSGQSAALLRFRLEVDTKDSGVDGKDIILWAAEDFPEFWTPGGENAEGRVTLESDTWYYFTRVAEPGETTQVTLESVSFNKELSNDKAHDTDVSGKQIDVKVKAEMIQVSTEAAQTLFGRTYTLSENDQIQWQ